MPKDTFHHQKESPCFPKKGEQGEHAVHRNQASISQRCLALYSTRY